MLIFLMGCAVLITGLISIAFLLLTDFPDE